MRTLKIIIVALTVMYIGVEAIGNIREDVTYWNQSDVRDRMEVNAAAYEARYN